MQYCYIDCYYTAIALLSYNSIVEILRMRTHLYQSNFTYACKDHVTLFRTNVTSFVQIFWCLIGKFSFIITQNNLLLSEPTYCIIENISSNETVVGYCIKRKKITLRL